MALTDVTVEAVVELLVNRLTSVSVQLRGLAEGMDKNRADHVRCLAELLDWMARDAVLVNMRWEERCDTVKWKGGNHALVSSLDFHSCRWKHQYEL